MCRLSIPVTRWLSQTTEREGMFIWGSQFPKDWSKAYWLHCLELTQGPDKVRSRWWPGNKGRQKRAGLNHSPKVHPQSHLLVSHPFSCELLDGLTMAEISFFQPVVPLVGHQSFNTWHFICKSQHGPNLWGFFFLLSLIMNASYVSILWNDFCSSWVHHFP